jgi:transcription initiation protein SPT3
MTPAKKTTAAPADVGEKKKEYKYQQEISQMVSIQTAKTRAGFPNVCLLQMFVFGEIQEPLTETVNLVENIIRSQLVELVCSSLVFTRLAVDLAFEIVQARAQANRRNARYLSAEDLIFLIRHDRAKVNRLRTYLSWKEVRKHAKDSNADGGGGVEVENLEDGADGAIRSFIRLLL